jgi:3-keto-disaccharide hydrolase
MKKSIIILLALMGLMACKNKKTKELVTEQNTTNITQKDTAWEILFDGTSFDKWRGYNTDTIYPEWTIDNGAMAFTPGTYGGKNIITKKVYTNFILSLEWKISEAGNSGIFWGVFEDPKFKEAYQTGPEIQVLDNERHPDAKIGGKLHQAGALYDMVEPKHNVVNPAGEWNTCVIKIDYKNNLGVVTLNGTEIERFPVKGPQWDAMIAGSKFANWDGFGKHQTGHIGLQDHGNKVWYRNIKIKRLD